MIDLAQLSDATLACHLTMQTTKLEEAETQVSLAHEKIIALVKELHSRGLNACSDYPFKVL